jgi:hypothetical protein
MMQDAKVIYCMDSSTLMNFEDRFPEDIFIGLWDDLGELIQEGRLVSHREVYEEIQQGGGFLTEWAKSNHHIFKDHTAEQAKVVGDIVNQFPALSGAHKTTAFEADAWLIAQSICEGKSLTVVTDESPKPHKRRIPIACETFGVPWMNGYQLLREEKWQYVRARK